MIYILIFIIIVIIFLILYLLKTKSISGFFNFNQKIIKGTYTKNKFKYIEEDTETAAKADLNKINVFIGNNPTSSFLKLGGKYLVRAQLVEYYSSYGDVTSIYDSAKTENENKIYNTLYLNSTGNMCIDEEPNECYNRTSNRVEPIILIDKEQINILNNSGNWTFESVNKTTNNFVHYGEPIYIRNISKNGGYLSVCDRSIGETDDTMTESETKCGKTMDIYKYSNLEDVKENGQWVLIPKYDFDSEFKGHLKSLKCKLPVSSNDANSICRSFDITRELPSKTELKTKYSIDSLNYESQTTVDKNNLKCYIHGVDNKISHCKIDDDNKCEFDKTRSPEIYSILDKTPETESEKKCKECVFWPKGSSKIMGLYDILDKKCVNYTNESNDFVELTKPRHKGNYVVPSNDGLESNESAWKGEINGCVNLPPPKIDLTPKTSTTEFIFYTGDEDSKDEENDKIFFKKYLETLNNKKIKVRLGNKHTGDASANKNVSSIYEGSPVSGDLFYIMNTKIFNGKYIYLNRCIHDSFDYECNTGDSNNKKKYNKVIGSVLDHYFLSNKESEKTYLWNIIPINYNVNTKNTLYVHNSIKLGKDKDAITITADSLRRIKNLPYVFNKELCLKKKNGDQVCIKKEHIEMMRGDINMNIESYVDVHPFTLYSKPNFQGRELRFGFNYSKISDLPFLKNSWEETNPSDDGKWKSLKIDGPYTIIIYDKTNGGSGDGDTNRCDVCVAKKPELDGGKKPDLNVQDDYDDCETSCNNVLGCKYVKTIDTTANSIVKIATGKYCKHSTFFGEEIGQLGISECAKRCAGTGGFVQNTRGNMDCGCVDPLCEYTSTSDEEDYDIYSTRGAVKGKCVSSAGVAKKKTITGSIADVTWPDGIRSVSFPYFIKDKDGETKMLNKNPIERKCMGADMYINNDKDIPMFTFKDCNNAESQHYRVVNSDHYKDKDYFFDDSNTAKHGHFHRHNLDELHE